MPWGDGTGPAGMGPMTGRAAGFCAGYGVPGNANPIGGREGFGFGFGRGGGRGRGGWGRRNMYYATGLPGWQSAGYPAAVGYGAAVPYETPYAGVPYAPTKEQQTDILKDQAEYLEDQLAGIKKRLEEIEAEKK